MRLTAEYYNFVVFLSRAVSSDARAKNREKKNKVGNCLLPFREESSRSAAQFWLGKLAAQLAAAIAFSFSARQRQLAVELAVQLASDASNAVQVVISSVKHGRKTSFFAYGDTGKAPA